jgi:hypothetical protein
VAVHKLDRFFASSEGPVRRFYSLTVWRQTSQIDGASQLSRRMIICFCLITRIAREFSGTVAARARRMRASSPIPLGKVIATTVDLDQVPMLRLEQYLLIWANM